MNNSYKVIRAIELRLAVAVVGYFVLFSSYLFLLAAFTKHAIGFFTLLKISVSTLTLPFSDLIHSPVLLVQLLRSPAVAAEHTFHAEIVKVLITGISMELALFACIAAAIVAFERSPHTRSAILFFYAFIPALLWLLWSQLYLFVG